MGAPFTTLDRYLLRNVSGTLASVFSLVIALMLFEHLPRLFDVVRVSGRRGFIVMQSLLALIPEYAGIALLFGLYLAIALTVRRLSLRAELDVIEATGVPPRRWMRAPALLALLVAALLLWTQGWLMPAGERRLNELSRQMQDGSLGFALEVRQFVDLGKGVSVRFDRIEPATGALGGVFVRDGNTVFAAKRGRLGFNLDGDVLIDLDEGLSITDTDRQALSFSHFHFDSGRHPVSGGGEPDRSELRKGMSVPQLLASRDGADRAAAWSRLLWPIFALMVPMLALVLGKPARRTDSSLGLMTGVVSLVLFIRTAGLIATAGAAHPVGLAIGVTLAWSAITALLVIGERRHGAGYIDAWLRNAVARVVRRRSRNGEEFAGSTEDQNLSRRHEVQTPGAPSWKQRRYDRSSMTLIGEHTGHGTPRPSASI